MPLLLSTRRTLLRRTDWLDGWRHRSLITITENSAAALTNYQTQIDVTYDANMQADFDDIRFTLDDGLTELSYWLEEKTDSTSATFWVKVPAIPASGITQIYMYYGNPAASTTSDIHDTFIDGDEFTRATLSDTQPWTKSGSNPLTGYGYLDPFAFYEGSTIYVFAYDVATKNITLFTAPDSDPATLTDQGTILDLGAGGSWDDFKVGDAHVVKVGSTYHLFYMGADGTGVTGIKIGHATASAIDGPYTKDGSNPVFSKASNGTNEPCVVYEGLFYMTYTYATSGSTTDVDHKNIGYATSADGTTWTDQGQIFSGTTPQNNQAVFGGDQFHYRDHDQTWHMFLNDGGNPTSPYPAEMYHSVADSMDGDWSGISRGGTVNRTSGSYDAIATWAPSIVYINGTYYMYYQAQDATGGRLALATSTTLSRNYNLWQEVDFTGEFVISSNRIFKTTGDATWNRVFSLGPLKNPPYVIESNLAFSAYSGSGDMAGFLVANDSAGVDWLIVFNLSTNNMRLWEYTIFIHDTNASHTLATGENGYKIRAKVTSSTINVDWYDGSSWNTDVLTVAGESFAEGAGGYYGFGTSANQFYGDNFRAREYASTEPSVSIGTGETR